MGMRLYLRLQTTNSRTLALFAPMALCVLVLILTVYFVTHQTAEPRPSRQQQLLVGHMQPSPLKEAQPSIVSPDTDFTRHVEQLKKRLPGREFTIIVQSPFVVIGDGTPAAVKSQAETVRWAVEKLKQEYFQKDP